MLQQDDPDDFVLATGETHPVKEFVEKAFSHVGITIKCVLVPFSSNGAELTFGFCRWEGPIETVEEVGVCAQTGRTLVRVDPRYFVRSSSRRGRERN